MLWFSVLILLLAIACDPDIHAKQPVDRVEHSIRRAVAYLDAEYERGAFGLLPESPVARPNKHWLATDNQVAVLALRAADEEAFAVQLERALKRWGVRRHGIIEALTGEPISWPPHPKQQFVVGPYLRQWTATQPNACSEPKDSPEKVTARRRAIPKCPALTTGRSTQIWHSTAPSTHVTGATQTKPTITTGRQWSCLPMLALPTKRIAAAKKKYYTTYKLALALFVGSTFGEPVEDRLLTALLDKQNKSGGFVALYDSQGVGQGDSNTETTAYALLALATLQNERSGHGGAVVCPRD